MTSYGMKRTVETPYERTVERVTEELKEEGFGVLTHIDVKATLKKKIDVDFRRYEILGACNPPLAHRALSAELDVGTLLPCNVIVYERDDGKTEVVAMDPEQVIGSAGAPEELRTVAGEVRERLGRVLERIA